MAMTLWRAADDATWSDCASFATTRATAEMYRRANPGFGGARLYRADVEVDESRVLDLTDDAARKLAAIGLCAYDGLGVDEYVPRVAYELREAGYDWVTVRESYPADSTTWIFVGALDAEPELEEVE
jgi:hypothetical protein